MKKQLTHIALSCAALALLLAVPSLAKADPEYTAAELQRKINYALSPSGERNHVIQNIRLVNYYYTAAKSDKVSPANEDQKCRPPLIHRLHHIDIPRRM